MITLFHCESVNKQEYMCALGIFGNQHLIFLKSKPDIFREVQNFIREYKLCRAFDKSNRCDAFKKLCLQKHVLFLKYYVTPGSYVPLHQNHCQTNPPHQPPPHKQTNKKLKAVGLTLSHCLHKKAQTQSAPTHLCAEAASEM